MISADDRGERREIAQRLVAALAPVLADVAEPGAVQLARDAAQIVALPGLERLLDACAPRAGVPWPPELSPVLERVRALAARALESGSLAPFVEADLELAGIAGAVSAWREPPASRGAARPGAETTPEDPGAPATLTLADTLEEMTIADRASRDVADRARLSPQVAAALRAALDWMAGESRRPLTLREEDSVLEVQIDRVEPEGIAPAGEVLAAVDGNLGPALGGPPGSWLVRVPLHATREVYLMLVRGGVPIAIPWHAVLRLRMAGSAEVAGRRALGDWPILESPLSAAPSEPGSELPLALVAHGRRRAWLVADRLVWRLPAERVDAEERAPAEGLRAMVRTEEDERFWLAEPAWLLRDVDAPQLSRAPRASAIRDRGAAPVSRIEPPNPVPPHEPIEPPPIEPPNPVPPHEPIEPPPIEPPSPVPPHEPIEPPPAQPSPGLRVLSRGEVEPIEAERIAPHEIAPSGHAHPAAPHEIEPRKTVRHETGLENHEREQEEREPEPRVIRRERIVPVPPAPPREAVVREPAPVPLVREAGPAPAPGEPAPLPRSARTALVAEDSITARVFLTRLLERLGFEVRAVETAAALRAEFEHGSWSIACVDVELPDVPAGPGDTRTPYLESLVGRYGSQTAFVALVRDADDRAAANRAGIVRTLRKPFDPVELEQVLARLGLVPRRPR